MNRTEKLKRFQKALDLFLERVRKDPNLLAAVLVCNILQLLWRQRWPAVEFARAPAPCIAHFVA